MTLRVPVAKIASVGMRKLGDPAVVKKAMETVRGRPRIKRTMWSRRAQEYEAKINSGDLIAISEVVRDLFRSENQPNSPIPNASSTKLRSIGWRREIAAVNKCSEPKRPSRIEQNLAKSPSRLKAAAAAEASEDDDEDQEAARLNQRAKRLDQTNHQDPASAGSFCFCPFLRRPALVITSLCTWRHCLIASN